MVCVGYGHHMIADKVILSENGELQLKMNGQTGQRSDLVDHCHAEDFNGGICDIAHAQKHGMCFCREQTDANCKSVDCDIMFVKPQSKNDNF